MTSVLIPSPPRPTPDIPETDELYEIVDGIRVEKTVSAYAAWIATNLAVSLSPAAQKDGFGT